MEFDFSTPDPVDEITQRESWAERHPVKEAEEVVEVIKERTVKCWRCGKIYPAKDIGCCFID